MSESNNPTTGDAKNTNAPSGDPPKHARRAVDRGESDGGIQAGGRRRSDKSVALPRSHAAKVAIACSFFFSIGLVAWAFTLPFRSAAFDDPAVATELPEGELANLEYEARLSSREYVNYTRGIDRRLLSRVRDQHRTNPQLPGKSEARERWEQRNERKKQQLNRMREDSGEEMFTKGTLEWQNLKDLEKVFEDAPPEA